MNGTDTRYEQRLKPRQPWHSWGSPVGLGLGLVSMSGVFVLLAQALSTLASIS